VNPEFPEHLTPMAAAADSPFTLMAGDGGIGTEATARNMPKAQPLRTAKIIRS
jgi:hypothetical protein